MTSILSLNNALLREEKDNLLGLVSRSLDASFHRAPCLWSCSFLQRNTETCPVPFASVDGRSLFIFAPHPGASHRCTNSEFLNYDYIIIWFRMISYVVILSYGKNVEKLKRLNIELLTSLEPFWTHAVAPQPCTFWRMALVICFGHWGGVAACARHQSWLKRAKVQPLHKSRENKGKKGNTPSGTSPCVWVVVVSWLGFCSPSLPAQATRGVDSKVKSL